MSFRPHIIRLTRTSLLLSIALCSCASADSTRSNSTAGATAAATIVPSPTQTPLGRGMNRGPMNMMGGWHPASGYGCLYYSGTKVTLRGTVEQTASVIPRPHMMQGLQLVLRADNKNLVVHLGPSWFVGQQNFALSKGDTVVVEGRNISAAGDSFVMASRVTKGKETLTLRNEDGRPLWAGVWGAEGPSPASLCPAQ